MTLHLSLLTLDRRAPEWRRLTPRDLHALVWKGAHGGDNRVLYRHDEGERAHAVLVQSERAPDWSALPPGTARTKTFDPPAVSVGQTLRFRLRANPVVARRGDAYADGRPRRALVGSHSTYAAERLGVAPDALRSREELLVDWLARKGPGGGFSLAEALGEGGQPAPACAVGPPTTLRVRRPGSDAPLTYVGVEFTGLLRVTEPAALAETVRGGVGRGKAYGFGLLSLAPLT